jgi:hypothetical protein
VLDSKRVKDVIGERPVNSWQRHKQPTHPSTTNWRIIPIVPEVNQHTMRGSLSGLQTLTQCRPLSTYLRGFMCRG